jgi:hypothetical protein
LNISSWKLPFSRPKDLQPRGHYFHPKGDSSDDNDDLDSGKGPSHRTPVPRRTSTSPVGDNHTQGRPSSTSQGNGSSYDSEQRRRQNVEELFEGSKDRKATDLPRLVKPSLALERYLNDTEESIPAALNLGSFSPSSGFSPQIDGFYLNPQTSDILEGTLMSTESMSKHPQVVNPPFNSTSEAQRLMLPEFDSKELFPQRNLKYYTKLVLAMSPVIPLNLIRIFSFFSPHIPTEMKASSSALDTTVATNETATGPSYKKSFNDLARFALINYNKHRRHERRSSISFSSEYGTNDFPLLSKDLVYDLGYDESSNADCELPSKMSSSKRGERQIQSTPTKYKQPDTLNLHAGESNTVGKSQAAVRLLLEKGANVNSKGSTDGQTPLSRAAQNRHEAVIQLLLERKVDIDAKDRNGQTALYVASGNGHEAVVQLRQLDSKDSDGWMLLSCINQAVDAVSCLLGEARNSIFNSPCPTASALNPEGLERYFKDIRDCRAHIEAILNPRLE